MPDTPNPRQQFPQERKPHGDPRPSHHEREWLAHVEAGRIGSKPTQTDAQRIRHARNELILRGRGV